MHLLEVLRHGSLLPVALRFYSVLGISRVVEKLPERCWGSADEAGHFFSCSMLLEHCVPSNGVAVRFLCPKSGAPSLGYCRFNGHMHLCPTLFRPGVRGRTGF